MLPHATVAGGHRIVYQRIVRLAARGHEIGLASFCDEDGRSHAAELAERIAEIKLLPPPDEKHMPTRLYTSILRRIPPWFMPYYSPEMYRLVGEMVDGGGYQIAMAEFADMGQYLYRNPWLPAVRRVISSHHSPSLVYRRSLEILGFGIQGLRMRFYMRGVEKFETAMYRAMDHLIVLTPQDRYWLLNAVPRLPVSVVPGGVDVKYFQPRPYESSEPVILFTGRYDDESNLDAVRWFIQRIWPHLREHPSRPSFLVVGPHPPAEIREHARQDERIQVTGRVPDLREYFRRARVFACPVRIGSGMRTKVLEAMAAGVPVVSTTLGMEGIPAQIGENCLLADDPDIMAENIKLLLEDEYLNRRLAANARRMVTERFAWDRTIDLLEDIFQNLLPHATRSR